MSNFSQVSVVKVIPYCQDSRSSCGLFAWGKDSGRAPAGTIFKPMFFSGKPSRTSMPLINSPSTLRPMCPEGWVADNSGSVPSCKKIKTSSQFSGFDWGGIFGGNKGGGDENLADDNIGQMPDEVGGKSGGGGKVSADQIMSGIESATELAKLFGTKRELSEVEGVCGKQPRGLARKSKKQAWANCASAYMQSRLDASKSKDGKGLSTGAWIGIGLGAVAVVGGIIFAITRKPQQVVMMQASPVGVK